MTKPKRYTRGKHILTLDELIKQEFVYWNDKITHRGWFMSWQIQMAVNALGKNGRIYYAKKRQGDITK